MKNYTISHLLYCSSLWDSLEQVQELLLSAGSCGACSLRNTMTTRYLQFSHILGPSELIQLPNIEIAITL